MGAWQAGGYSGTWRAGGGTWGQQSPPGSGVACRGQGVGGEQGWHGGVGGQDRVLVRWRNQRGVASRGRGVAGEAGWRGQWRHVVGRGVQGRGMAGAMCVG